jgi:DNA-binding transcriptional MerR regulator
MMMTMKAEPRKSHPKKELSLRQVADDALMASFDPVIEGSTFLILEADLDPAEFSRHMENADEMETPEVLATFDLADSLSRIPDKLFFRIGEVAELLDVKTYVLRFWETEFKMVHPSKSRSGQRVYRKKDVEILLLIKHLLYVERFSIEGARKRLREMKAKSSKKLAPKGSASTEQEESKKEKPTPVSPDSREEVRALLIEIDKLSQPDLSQFFRF